MYVCVKNLKTDVGRLSRALRWVTVLSSKTCLSKTDQPSSILNYMTYNFSWGKILENSKEILSVALLSPACLYADTTADADVKKDYCKKICQRWVIKY